MRKQSKKVSLARETVRQLDEPGLRGGPYGTETASISPTECCTASCRHIC